MSGNKQRRNIDPEYIDACVERSLRSETWLWNHLQKTSLHVTLVHLPGSFQFETSPFNKTKALYLNAAISNYNLYHTIIHKDLCNLNIIAIQCTDITCSIDKKNSGVMDEMQLRKLTQKWGLTLKSLALIIIIITLVFDHTDFRCIWLACYSS